MQNFSLCFLISGAFKVTVMPGGIAIAKICDFGIAEIKPRLTITQPTKVKGTAMYYPPEYSNSECNPRKADVYSLGATLCELFTNVWFWHHPDNRPLEDTEARNEQYCNYSDANLAISLLGYVQIGENMAKTDCNYR